MTRHRRTAGSDSLGKGVDSQAISSKGGARHTAHVIRATRTG